MRISIKINGNEVFNSDVMMLLYREGMKGLQFSLPDGAKVEMLAQNEKVEGMVLYQSYIHVEPKECGCCCHECLQDGGNHGC